MPRSSQVAGAAGNKGVIFTKLRVGLNNYNIAGNPSYAVANPPTKLPAEQQKSHQQDQTNVATQKQQVEFVALISSLFSPA